MQQTVPKLAWLVLSIITTSRNNDNTSAEKIQLNKTYHILLDCFLGECAVPGLNATFVFFGLPVVSCSMINSLILGCCDLLYLF